MDLTNIQETQNTPEVETTTAEVEVKETQPVQEVKEEVSKQDTQPEPTEEKEEIKSFTQKELDELIERRLSRQYSSFVKEKEEAITAKATELTEKLTTYESDNKALAEEVQKSQAELTRLRFGIKEDTYEEVLALKEFRMGKNPDLTEDQVLQAIIDERPDYKTQSIQNIGIEIKRTEEPGQEYSDQLIKQFPWLAK